MSAAYFDPKAMRTRAKSRMREIVQHTRELRKELKNGSAIGARLAAIRLAVWAEAVKTMLDEEVGNYMKDKA